MAVANNGAQQQLQGFIGRQKPQYWRQVPGGGIAPPSQPDPNAPVIPPITRATPPPSPPGQPSPLAMPQAQLTPAQAKGSPQAAQKALQNASAVATPVAVAITGAKGGPYGNQRGIANATFNLSTAQQRREARYQARQQARDIAAVTNIAREVGNSATSWATRISDRVAALPTPGGIGVMILILLGFLWAVVPVNNGLTRAQLFYLTITRKTALSPDTVGGAAEKLTGNQADYWGFGTPTGVQALSYTVGGAAPTSTGASGGGTTFFGSIGSTLFGGAGSGQAAPTTPQPTPTPVVPLFDFGANLGPQLS